MGNYLNCDGARCVYSKGVCFHCGSFSVLQALGLRKSNVGKLNTSKATGTGDEYSLYWGDDDLPENPDRSSEIRRKNYSSLDKETKDKILAETRKRIWDGWNN